MREEEREVDGLELEQIEEQRQEEIERGDAEEFPDLDRTRQLDPDSRTQLAAAIRAIFEERELVINDLELPQRELRALEALKAAVEGKDSKLSRFVFASDRRDLLEQALAVLQPNAGEIQMLMPDLIHKVGDLRDQLRDLEDAQDDLLEGNPEVVQAKTDADSDDKPGDKPKRKPGAKPEPDDAAERGDKPSTLYGPERPEPKKPASSLTGPERPEPEKPASSLGDPAEIEAVAKNKPWWRRPFGG